MMRLFLALALLSAPQASPPERLRPAGVLGNSGDGDLLFAGRLAPGIGPVIDEAGTIWERGGAGRLNRYAVDGRLLASFPLPDEAPASGDQLTRVASDLLILLRGRLYRLSTSDAAPRALAARARGMSSNAHGGRVALLDGDALSWFAPATEARTPAGKAEGDVDALHLGDDGTIYGFGGGKVRAWKDGRPVPGYPKDFEGTRPRFAGGAWYSQSWHGTIYRYNAAFEPDPGVVLGGASGTFIGYLPRSVDVTLGAGVERLRDNLFVVSGNRGVVQLMFHEDAFRPVRRIGALPILDAVALNAQGDVWTPNGTWRWDDGPHAPLSLGDDLPEACGQPVVLDGSTLVVLRRHYGDTRWARGPFLDESGWAKFDVRGFPVPGKRWPVAAAAFETAPGRRRLLAVDASGAGFEVDLGSDGSATGAPAAVELPGLKACTSLAAFQGRVLAADGHSLLAFARGADGRWSAPSVVQRFEGPIHIHADGRRLAVVETAKGRVSLHEALPAAVATFDGLDAPTRVAVAGDRLVVYESGRQRLLKLEKGGAPAAAAPRPQKIATPSPRRFTDAEYVDYGRPGGIPWSLALAATGEGLDVSIRTTASEAAVGVAHAGGAYVFDGLRPTRLPAGDATSLKLAVALASPSQKERAGFLDHRPIHAPFSDDPSTWAPFDLKAHRETVAERELQIRIEFDQAVAGEATLVIENEAGERIRNLVSGRAYGAGRQVAVWDGLDENGKLVAPGTYRWRGATHAGIRPEFRSVFANGDEPTTKPWGTNHGLLHHAVSDSKHVYFAAPVTEGGWALLAVDADGRFVQGYEHQQGFGIGHNAIAVDEKYLYCAQDGFGWGGSKDVDFKNPRWTSTWTLTVARYDLRSGKVVPFPGNKRAFEADTMAVGPGSEHPDLDRYNLGGIAVHDGRLYVGSRGKKAVLVFDAETGAPREPIPLEGVRHLAARNGVFAATDKGVVRLSDKRLLVSLEELAGLTIAPNGDILVSDGSSHQVRRFDAAGKPLGTVGAPGGPYKGRYDPRRMVRPAGLAVGPDGKIWVTEKRWNPKRILAWDREGKTVVAEKFGMPHYGGAGAGFDPADAGRWIGLGCFWDVDVATGRAKPTHVLAVEPAHFGHYHPQGYRMFREGGRTFVEARGMIALISEVRPDGSIHDLVAAAGTHHFAYGCEWDPPQAYIDAFYARFPEARAKEKPGKKGEGKPWASRGYGVLWADRNGDGAAQADEFDFVGPDVDFAGGAWGHLQSSLTLRFPVAQGGSVGVAVLRPAGVHPGGAPAYPPLREAIQKAAPVPMRPGYKRNGVATVSDRFGRFIFNSDPELNTFGADGRLLWTYPNRWSDVHGSHQAPLPETGVLQGSLAFLGIAPLDKTGDVFFINGNHGRCFLMTSDGLYLDEAFTDVRVSYLKNEYRLGGEIFGGMFDRSADGRYYVQVGHGPYRIYELKGLDSVRRIEGTVEADARRLAAAEAGRRRRLAETRTARAFEVPGTLSWDRNGKFKVTLEAAVEKDVLVLTYHVQDPSPWVNRGRDWTTLFASGDSVDLQIGTDAGADPGRRSPVRGDKRLLIAPHEGRPIAVLYEHVKPGGGHPVEFTSPWRGARVDDVRRLEDVAVDVKVAGQQYRLTARIPLKTLGLAASNRPLRADFGVTYGDAEGTDTQLRSYWANPATMLVDDIPGEIMLHPNLWGEVRFKAP